MAHCGTNVPTKDKGVGRDLRFFWLDTVSGWSHNGPMSKATEKRVRDESIRWRIRAEDKELLQRVADAEGRSMSNWLEYHVLPLARRLLEEGNGE